MSVELSDGTIRRIERLFSAADREAAARLLVSECGSNLPWYEDATPASLERVRFAALKLSEGDIPKLQDAILLAQTDWRDLLMAADFGFDVTAHSAWWPGDAV